MSAIYHLPPQTQVSQALQRRMQSRISKWSDDSVFAYLADTLYTERRRIEEENSDTHPSYLRAIQTASKAIQGHRDDMCTALLALVRVYSTEIHNNFSERTYRIASKVLPSALSSGKLLAMSSKVGRSSGSCDIATRTRGQGL